MRVLDVSCVGQQTEEVAVWVRLEILLCKSVRRAPWGGGDGLEREPALHAAPASIATAEPSPSTQVPGEEERPIDPAT